MISLIHVYITCARKHAHTHVHLSCLILFSICIFYISFAGRIEPALCVGVGISRRNYILLLLITMTKITRLAWALCWHAPFGAVFVWVTGFCCGSPWETLSIYDMCVSVSPLKPIKIIQNQKSKISVMVPQRLVYKGKHCCNQVYFVHFGLLSSISPSIWVTLIIFGFVVLNSFYVSFQYLWKLLL